ncbi:BMP family ABC transporter substrate-binding protein [Virgibacillus profundi]|uniref:BMP family ABC transporter substrate-binding protein n=1 Tax=Virgibacillus profundi TaxID=2024555 RepID=A0A2A2IDJ3_9BACI|nr:BMP family ABC transporter substrate-binding protein [Virgibacillus profundi]PAV29205.1 BMP family ABC transporter substrate-binding protein [Virgibacillus profundi]PXY53374.1 BMP family ABC transporter substrate-binding protein [Virgibacillus profundi]
MKKTFIILLFILTLIIITGCSGLKSQDHIQNVGMLVDGTIESQAWNEKGYEGLQQIGEQYDVNVFYKENIVTEQEIESAVNEFVEDGVNLIFGHSSIYGNYFIDIAENYPDVHFVYFNGGYSDDNVTSLNFNAHAMGFFSGMIAAEMTDSNHVGMIAAFQWQPEIEGFFEGVKYQNPSAEVTVEFVNNWNDKETAADLYEKMRENNVDVIYPTGDSYSEEIIKRASEDGIYAIGYVANQSEIDENTVLTSTVQHVDKLYEITAEKFNEGELEGSILTFDFADEVISLGEFSPSIPESFQKFMEETVETYIETDLLPNER